MIAEKVSKVHSGSFLVRLWKDGGDEWLGEIQHIQSGMNVKFTGLEGISGVCAAIIGETAEEKQENTPESPVQRSNKGGRRIKRVF